MVPTSATSHDYPPFGERMTKSLLDINDARRSAIILPAGLFVLVFVMTFLPSLQGFDLTDHGFHISQQYFDLASSMENSGTELYLGSEIAGHLWLRILEYPMLAWARVGGALLHSISALFAFLILIRYFSAAVSFWSVFFVALWMAGESPVIIQYYTLPATVSVLFLWTIDTAQRASTLEARRLVKWYVLAGVLGVLLAFSRLTLAPLVVLPLIPVAVAYWKDGERPGKSILSYAIGLLIGSLSIVLLLAIMGLLGTYVSEIFRTAYQTVVERGSPGSSSHNFTVLVKAYLREYVYAAVLTGVVLFLTTGLKLVITPKGDHRRRRTIAWTIVAVSVAGLVGAVILWPTLLSHSWITRITTWWITRIKTWSIARIITWTIIGLLINTAIRHIIVRRSLLNDRHLKWLFILGVIVVVFSSLGSNTGIIKNRYGFWIPLSVFIAALSQWLHGNITSPNITRRFAYAGTVLLLVGGMYNVYTNVYRDSPNRFQLIHEPDLPALRWTFTTRERAEWVENVVTVFERFPPDAEVFFVNASPGLYYVLNRPPVVGSSWFFIPSAEVVTRNLERVVQSGDLPDVVFIPNFKARSQTWPDETPISERYAVRLKILDNILLSPGAYTDISDDPTYRLLVRE